MRDGKQNVPIDRWLMRTKDFIQIAMTIGGVLWVGVQGVRAFDRLVQQVELLQQQVSSLQQLVVNVNKPRRGGGG